MQTKSMKIGPNVKVRECAEISNVPSKTGKSFRVNEMKQF